MSRAITATRSSVNKKTSLEAARKDSTTPAYCPKNLL
jgi:hypothetical protein